MSYTITKEDMKLATDFIVMFYGQNRKKLSQKERSTLIDTVKLLESVQETEQETPRNDSYTCTHLLGPGC